MKLKKCRGLMSYMLVFVMLMMTINPVFAVEKSEFLDVEGHWAETEITKAYNEQLVEGYPNDTFQPDKKITRAEFITLMNRFLYLKEMAEDNYLDVKETDWFSDETAKAKQIEYIIGDHARPEESCTREEVVSTLAELLSIQGEASTKTFNDLKGISEESKRNINGLVEKGYITGYPDKTFKPQGTITRAEILKMFNNALGTIVQNNDALNGINEIQGNLTIVDTGINLEGKTIKGDLYISPGALDKINLKDLKVTGRIIISGGSEDAPIELDNVKAKEITIRKTTGKANIEIIGKSEIEKITTKTETKIEAKKGTTIKELDIKGQAAGTQITGEGKIVKATIDAKDVTVEQKVIRVKVTKNAKSAVIDGRTNKYRSSSSSHSSSGSTVILNAALEVINAGTEVFEDFAKAGVTGAVEENTDGYDKAIAAAKTKKDSDLTLVEVQSEVNNVNQAILVISEMAGKNADSLTVAMLEIAGVIDVVSDYLAVYKTSVVGGEAEELNNLIEIQALIDVLNAYERVDETFPADITVTSGATITLTVPNGYTAWFAPADTDDGAFAEGPTMTTAPAGAISIKAPTTVGEYKFYLVDAYGLEYEGNYELTVVGAEISVTGVELKTSTTLTEGNTETLTAMVTPTNATNKKVIWSSDKKDVATVTSNGAIIAISPGKANITVTTEDGNKTATCEVTVNIDTGSGTEADPYKIYKLEDLDNVRNDLDAYYILINDLDFTDKNSYRDPAVNKDSWTTGEGWTPIGIYSGSVDELQDILMNNTILDGGFAGYFDGNGHTISDLHINRPVAIVQGLFGIVKGTVKDIGLDGGNITGFFEGQLAGFNYSSGKITNSFATGDVSGDYAGGLVGLNLGTIENSHAAGVVKGDCAGGLVGGNSGTIKNSHATGAVSGDGVGGLVGGNLGIIENSYATGAVNGERGGGLVGENSGRIEKSYATGNVTTSRTEIGGLAGHNDGIIKNSYATGNVSGRTDAGGLVGHNEGGTIENSYAVGVMIVQRDCVGGLVGDDYSKTALDDSKIIKNCIAFNTQIRSNEPEANRIVGGNTDTLTNNYANNSMILPSGTTVDKGLSTADGADMTTDDFKNLDSTPLSTWDKTIWEIKDGADRPTLIGVGNDDGKMKDVAAEALVAINDGTEMFEDFAKAGVTGVVEGNITGYDKAIAAAKIEKGSDLTFVEVQSEVNNVNKAITEISEMAENNNTDDLTVDMLKTAGVTDVVSDYLADYKISVVGCEAEELNNLIEIQALIDVKNAYKRVDEAFPENITVTSGSTITLTVPTGYTAWFAPADTDDGAFAEGPTMTTATAGAISITAPEDSGVYKFYLIRESGVAYEGMSTLTVSGEGSVASEFEGGDGTEGNPYQITKLEHLNNVRKYLGSEHTEKYFKLMNDLDFDVDSDYLDVEANKDSWITGEGWAPLGNRSFDDSDFTGTFNGNGYIISGLYINSTEGGTLGLFGYSSGTIENLGLIDVEISGYCQIGGLVGAMGQGTISKCYVTGTVGNSDSANVGGLVGYSDCGTITNSYATVDVSGDYQIGGLVGSHNGNYVGKGTITNSYSTGNVSGIENVGGLVGYSNVGKITNSIAFNIELSTNPGENKNFHRIAGYCEEYGLDNNYAKLDMKLPFFVTLENSLDGLDMENYEFKNPANIPLSSWDFTDIWEIKPDANRPTLKGVGDDDGKLPL